MATFSRVTPTGWAQGDDTSAASRVTPTGWQQIAAAGVTDTPVSTGVGALVITGYGPTVQATAHISVATGAGALTITGYAPTVQADGSVSVTTGTGELTLTGYAPTITVPVLVSTGVGTLTITGYAPTVGVSQSVTTGVGALVLTGYGPTISVTANTTVTPDAATLAIAGYAPSVSKTDHVSVATGAGALTITGYAPTVVEVAASPTVTVGAAELLLNTYAPIVVNSGDVVEQATGGWLRKAKDKRGAYDFLNPEHWQVRDAQDEDEAASAERTITKRVKTLSKRADELGEGLLKAREKVDAYKRVPKAARQTLGEIEAELAQVSKWIDDYNRIAAQYQAAQAIRAAMEDEEDALMLLLAA